MLLLDVIFQPSYILLSINSQNKNKNTYNSFSLSSSFPASAAQLEVTHKHSKNNTQPRDTIKSIQKKNGLIVVRWLGSDLKLEKKSVHFSEKKNVK